MSTDHDSSIFRVKTLDRLVAEAAVLADSKHPCTILGHLWVSTGGRNCCCDDGACSVPVHECSACGDCDYGDNEEADAVRAACAERREDV
jgi:hypothetical protein